MVEKSLCEDLLHEFREECEMINKQIKILEPIISHFDEPDFKKTIIQFVYYLIEFVGYLLFIAALYLLFFMHKITVFSTLTDAYQDAPTASPGTFAKINTLIIAGYGIVLLCGFLCLFIGIIVGNLRKKSSLLNDIGEDIGVLYQQHTARMAAIDALDQLHLINVNRPGVIEGKLDKVNSVRNPGFDEED